MLSSFIWDYSRYLDYLFRSLSYSPLRYYVSSDVINLYARRTLVEV